MNSYYSLWVNSAIFILLLSVYDEIQTNCLIMEDCLILIFLSLFLHWFFTWTQEIFYEIWNVNSEVTFDRLVLEF